MVAAWPGLSRASSRSGTNTLALSGVGSVTRNIGVPIGDFLAELDVARRHDAGERRADLAVRKIELREVVRGALIVEVVLEVFEGAGGHQPLLVQLDLTIEVALGLGERGARLRGLQTQLPIVELREHLAGAHAITFLDEDAGVPHRPPWR